MELEVPANPERSFLSLVDLECPLFSYFLPYSLLDFNNPV